MGEDGRWLVGWHRSEGEGGAYFKLKLLGLGATFCLEQNTLDSPLTRVCGRRSPAPPVQTFPSPLSPFWSQASSPPPTAMRPS